MLRVMGLGWSIFGDADTAAEERGQLCRADALPVRNSLSERGALLWLREPVGCVADK